MYILRLTLSKMCIAAFSGISALALRDDQNHVRLRYCLYSLRNVVVRTRLSLLARIICAGIRMLATADLGGYTAVADQ